MSISNAEFNAWVEQGLPNKTILVEIDYTWSFSDLGLGYDTVQTATLYFATRPYITIAGDTPASTPYVDVCDVVPTFSRQIDQRTLGGRTSMSFGELELKNPEGLLDFMLTLALDGQQVRVYIGDHAWARTDFRHVITALATGVTAPDTSHVVVGLSDTALLLNSAIGTSFIGGTGPNAERTQVVARGYCHNVEAVLKDITDLVYIFADDGAVFPVTNVRDNGLGIVDGLAIPSSGPVLIDAATDTITYSGHGFTDEDIVEYSSGGLTNGLVDGVRYFVRNSTADAFQLSVTRTGSVVNITSTATTSAPLFTRFNYFDNLDGTITLGHPPFGTVTCDIVGPEATDDDRRASSLFEALVTDYTTLDSEGLLLGAHPSYPVLGTSDFHLGVVVQDKQNLQDVLDSIAYSAIAFWGFTALGEFTYGRIGVALGTLTSQMTIADDDVVSFSAVNVWNAAPLYSRWNWYYSKNWTIQNADALAASLDPETVATFTRKGIYGSALNTTSHPPTVGFGGTQTYHDNPEAWHRTLTMSPETETLLSMQDPTSATAEATLWYQTMKLLFRPWGRFVQLDLRLSAYVLELGDLVTLNLTRYSLSSVAAQVCGLDIDLVDGVVRATLFFREDADVITAGGWHG